MNDLDKKLQLRLDIYFGLTTSQKRKLNTLFSWVILEEVSLEYFQTITQNKKLIEKFKQLKGL